MRTRIKICGIGSAEEARLAVAAGADALGFVSEMPMGRGTLPDGKIRALAASVAVESVLLTARRTAAAIADHVRATRPSAVQIVAHIDPAESARLAVLLPDVKRLQAVHVEGPEAVDLVAGYAPHVDALVLDSGRPSTDPDALGGTGTTHDWTISAQCVAASPRPVYLAGGLDAHNVAAAIAAVRPYGVDLFSGVRSGPALDAAKLAAFVRAVAEADAARG
ncbi:phosphoribosylanthranilate isomerase [Acuticoccus sp. I52.16.1]|uniref:phosphoribosylanthranilate isomerase n=1 Tax=Acuticoccus sp. I52.16.1 TaxID=2928472 RepID=UPI001FD08D6F|nr:phosphoribosylanthranilate isomerase [Acuticoccus sp. I52.16.1]UOM34979.1 phosphoribosylanthranilate isomerase [Acuticoccus sp. I52.16.1]